MSAAAPGGDSHGLGRWGEDLAARRLTALGYRILARNFRCAAGEADLIAVEDGALVVVEVKTRRSLRFGTPAESVTPRKAQRLLALLDAYREGRSGLPESGRVDVVGIVLFSGVGPPVVEIIRNAVEGA